MWFIIVRFILYIDYETLRAPILIFDLFTSVRPPAPPLSPPLYSEKKQKLATSNKQTVCCVRSQNFSKLSTILVRCLFDTFIY